MILTVFYRVYKRSMTQALTLSVIYLVLSIMEWEINK